MDSETTSCYPLLNVKPQILSTSCIRLRVPPLLVSRQQTDVSTETEVGSSVFLEPPVKIKTMTFIDIFKCSLNPRPS